MATQAKATDAKPKAMAKGEGTKSRTRQAAGKGEKLVCRYCGSDDLAPSFIKRRDARCRACFKKRYGSARREQKAARGAKNKAAK
jgi:hypothetical protein